MVSTEVNVTRGRGHNVTVTVAESVGVPQLSEMITVYVVVTDGVAIGFCVLGLFYPAAGIHR